MFEWLRFVRGWIAGHASEPAPRPKPSLRPKEPRTEPDQIGELMRILSERG
jgi:hypothetical protein